MKVIAYKNQKAWYNAALVKGCEDNVFMLDNVASFRVFNKDGQPIEYHIFLNNAS